MMRHALVLFSGVMLILVPASAWRVVSMREQFAGTGIDWPVWMAVAMLAMTLVMCVAGPVWLWRWRKRNGRPR